MHLESLQAVPTPFSVVGLNNTGITNPTQPQQPFNVPIINDSLSRVRSKRLIVGINPELDDSDLDKTTFQEKPMLKNNFVTLLNRIIHGMEVEFPKHNALIKSILEADAKKSTFSKWWINFKYKFTRALDNDIPPLFTSSVLPPFIEVQRYIAFVKSELKKYFEEFTEHSELTNISMIMVHQSADMVKLYEQAETKCSNKSWEEHLNDLQEILLTSFKDYLFLLEDRKDFNL